MLTLTDAAAAKAAELKANEAASGNQSENMTATVLRIAVQPGGCAGLRYDLFFDNYKVDGDTAITYSTLNGDLTVVVDPSSVPYLETATVDYVESIDKIGFVIDNPGASAGCACGDSFC